MSTQESWELIPPDWPAPPNQLIQLVTHRALVAVDSSAAPRLTAYYDAGTDFVGALFTDLSPHDWNDLTPTDLHAATLFGAAVGPHATRRLLAGPERRWVVAALGKLPDVELPLAGPDALSAMCDLHLAVTHAVSHPTATSHEASRVATVLCARKRPDLFPVWGPAVAGALGVEHTADPRPGWLLFRALLQNGQVRRRLHDVERSVAQDAGNVEVVLEASELRLLDTILRTYAEMPL